MRKITALAVEAFIEEYEFKRDNTRVVINDIDCTVTLWLYNTAIARKSMFDKKVFITNGGYETNTTKERLNGLLQCLHAPYIYQKNFNWYYDRSDGERRDFEYDKQSNGYVSVEYMKG